VRLRDPEGRQWMLSQRIEDVSAEQLERRAAAFFAQSGQRSGTPGPS
jgi:hypothetical protein